MADARVTAEDVVMSDDLVAFLHARLDEDVDLAERCDADGCGQWTARRDTVDFCQVDLSGFHPTIAEHVALHDPARVVREVTAKRRVLARHALSPAIGDSEMPGDGRNNCRYDGSDWPCPDLLDLALPYAEHPDYRVEWCATAAKRSSGW